MQAAADVPLFLGGGETFTCDGTAIPLLANVCSAGFQIGTLTADGTLEGLEPVDASRPVRRLTSLSPGGPPTSPIGRRLVAAAAGPRVSSGGLPMWV